MGPKHILLPVHADHGLDARLAAATALAQQFGATLLCLYARTPPGAGRAISASGMARLGEEDMRAGKRVRRAVETRLAEAGVEWDWHDYPGNVVDALVGEAPLADLIAVSPMTESGGPAVSEPVAEPLLLRSPTPLLIAPDGPAAFGTAMIAWNGSAQSALAMREALPLLRGATAVHIVTAAADIRQFPPERAAAYLRAHGIDSTQHIAEDAGADAAETLTREAERLGADYIVMGGYSRSRLNELIFGGVTRYMLRRPPVPIFIRH
ncbi:universal stress protein [Parasphingopyxis algicola]|uniref:universal stress protein n=1 Tax=Parasphingopyxis algicola TaxID=2026624 RepID=UPI00159FCA62|nr:universal stress protein [Parasphingopyxis algicola]QLC24456.1 universal stress protein [Parasphingopyxis algicola]